MPTNNIPPWANSNYTLPTQYRICNCTGNGTGRCCMDTTPAATTTVVWSDCPPHDYVQGEGGAGYVFCRRCADCKELLIGAE